MVVTRRYIVGPPGTGKTTWIQRQVESYFSRGVDPDQVYVCSLTKAAAKTAAGRIGEMENIGTIHSLAFRCLDNPKIAEAHIKSWNAEYPHWAIEPKISSVDDITAEMRYEDTDEGDRLIAALGWLRSTMTSIERWPGDVRAFHSKWQSWKAVNGLLDFTDLLDHCLSRRIRLSPRPRIIMIDEAQDLSELDRSLVEMWAEDAEEIIYVGDPDQCLYEFRGSDPYLIFPDATEAHILSQSYRVPVSVHDVAVSWISGMPGYRPYEYHPAKHTGEVERLPFTYHDGREIADLASSGNVVFLASCGYMLDPVIANLRDLGIAFANPLKPNNGKWNPLGNRRGVTISQRMLALLSLFNENRWTPDDIAIWIEPMMAKGILKHGKKTRLQSLTEESHIGEEIEAAFEPGQSPPLNRPEALMAWWEERLQSKHRERLQYPKRVYAMGGGKALSDPPTVHTGTIHSYKGGEMENVVLIPDLSPSGQSQWESGNRVSIYRGGYVGMTRAKERLYLLNSAAYGVF